MPKSHRQLSFEVSSHILSADKKVFKAERAIASKELRFEEEVQIRIGLEVKINKITNFNLSLLKHEKTLNAKIKDRSTRTFIQPKV